MIKILQDSTSRFSNPWILRKENYFALSPNSKLRNVILRINFYASIWPVAWYRGLESFRWREICAPRSPQSSEPRGKRTPWTPWFTKSLLLLPSCMVGEYKIANKSYIFWYWKGQILHPEYNQFHNFNRNWKDSTSTVTRFKGLWNVSNSFSKTSWFASRNIDFRGCETSRWLFS